MFFIFQVKDFFFFKLFYVVSPQQIPKTRSAMTDVHRRWPNGIIPYVISQTYGEFLLLLVFG